MGRTKSSWKTEIVGRTETAGVVGAGEYVENLKRKLEKQSCEVFVSPTLSSISTRLTYLFVFGDFENAFSLFTKKSFKETKILIVVERHPRKILDRLEKLVTKSENIRLLKIGEINAWKADSLSESCLWAMFGGEKNKVIDVSKESLVQPLTKKYKPNLWSIRFGRLAKIGLIIFILLSPILLTMIFFLMTIFQMRNVFFFLDWGDFDGVEKNLSSYEAIVVMQKKLMIPLPLYQDYINFFDRGVVLIKAVMVSRDGWISFRRAYESEEILLVRSKFEKMENEIAGLNNRLSKFSQDFKNIPVPFFDKRPYLEKMDELLRVIDFGEQLMPIAEQILFRDGTTKYLILFQNNTELRPTGGFIGSYALVNIEDGRVLNYSFHDVYEADGQLKAHVDPPIPIRNYLQQPNWFLRDSNFDPDFSISAQQAMWFLERETGQKVDGVVAVNLNLVTRLLDRLGGVYVPDYREEVDANNFLLKATTYAQEGFFPGSTAKRDFLRSTGNAIVYEIVDSNRVDYLTIASTMRESLERKDILLNSSDNNLQKMIEETGWGGRVVDVSCVEDNCFPDYFLAVDANLGVNKANLYVSKRTTIEKLFDESKGLITQVILEYVNESPADVFPAGTYKNYLRIFVPEMVTVEDVSLDGKSIIGEVSLASYGEDKQEAGFLVEVLPQSSRMIILRYVIPFPKTMTAYQFFLAKQPGEREGSVDLTFRFPETLTASPSNFKPIYSSGVYSYITDSAVDRIFVFDMTK